MITNRKNLFLRLDVELEGETKDMERAEEDLLHDIKELSECVKIPPYGYEVHKVDTLDSDILFCTHVINGLQAQVKALEETCADQAKALKVAEDFCKGFTDAYKGDDVDYGKKLYNGYESIPEMTDKLCSKCKHYTPNSIDFVRVCYDCIMSKCQFEAREGE